MQLQKLFLSNLILICCFANPVKIDLNFDRSTREFVITGDVEPEWHIYWKNPGEIGFPSKFEIELDGDKITPEVEWSVPEIFYSAKKKSYGFSKKFQAKFILPPGNEIKVISRLLGCSKSICKPMKLENTNFLANMKPATEFVNFPAKVFVVRTVNRINLGQDLTGRELASGTKAEFKVVDLASGVIETQDTQGELLILGNNPVNFIWKN